MRKRKPQAVIDEIDHRILALLQEDASLSSAAIAERVGLSPSPCWRRIQKLEEAGVIARRVALLDAERLGLHTVVFASVKLSAHGRQSLPDFERGVREYPEVMECYTTSGEEDFILRVVTPDVHAYEEFLREHLLQLPTVQEVHSRIAITQVKYSTELPMQLVPISEHRGRPA